MSIGRLLGSLHHLETLAALTPNSEPVARLGQFLAIATTRSRKPFE